MSFVKDPDSTLDYTIDWTEWLAGTDTISTSTWIVPAGLTKVSDTKSLLTTTVWIRGGTAGTSYTVTNRIVTVNGRTDDRSINLVIEEALGTSIFGVTAAMVKDGRFITSLTDAVIRRVAQEKEYWIATKTGYTTVPSDPATLGNLRAMVCLATAIHVKNMDPHSEGDGSYRYDHFPQATWQQELDDYWDQYLKKDDNNPVLYEQAID